MKTLLIILGVVSCAGSIVAAESVDPGLLSELPEITQRLNLDAGQKTQVEALLRQAEPEMRRLTDRESALNAQRKNLQTSMHLDLKGVMTEEQYRDFVSSHITLSEDQRSRAGAILKGYEPRLVEAQNESDVIGDREEALHSGLWTGIAALLNPEQKKKIGDLKTALAEVRRARRALAHLQGLAENPEVLGIAYKRVRAAEAARAGLIAPWMAAWKDKDMRRFELLLSRDFKGSSWSDFSLKRKDHVAKEYRSASYEILDRRQALASMREWLGKYQKIAGCDLELFGAEENGAETRF